MSVTIGWGYNRMNLVFTSSVGDTLVLDGEWVEPVPDGDRFRFDVVFQYDPSVMKRFVVRRRTVDPNGNGKTRLVGMVDTRKGDFEADLDDVSGNPLFVSETIPRSR
ncbi:MAG: hypothetical protein MJZ68_06655 [archaeon]|nr:hypothetical protein [archaeon]